MDVSFEAYLQSGAVTFDGDDARLLRAIDEQGSLNAAAETLGRSYSRAHKRLTELEGELGRLVDRERGGTGGGGSALTDSARETLAQFSRVRAVLEGTVSVQEVVLPGTVTDRTGELVTVATEAGEIRALLGGPGGQPAETVAADGRVEVTLGADSVTLQDPTAAPRGDETSARNRIVGTVTTVEDREAVATVTVDVGGPTPLVVLVTAESRDRLDLTAGRRVAATFKATAARATPIGGESG